MTRTPDFLADLAAESQRFAEVMAGVDPSAPVPSCPDWTAADLLWHLTEVQMFWATMVRERLLDPDAADVEAPDHPAEYSTLRGLCYKAWPALHTTLFLIGIMHDLRRLVAQQGWPRINMEVDFEALAQMAPDDAQPGTAGFEKWLTAIIAKNEKE